MRTLCDKTHVFSITIFRLDITSFLVSFSEWSYIKMSRLAWLASDLLNLVMATTDIPKTKCSAVTILVIELRIFESMPNHKFLTSGVNHPAVGTPFYWLHPPPKSPECFLRNLRLKNRLCGVVGQKTICFEALSFGSQASLANCSKLLRAWVLFTSPTSIKVIALSCDDTPLAFLRLRKSGVFYGTLVLRLY